MRYVRGRDQRVSPVGAPDRSATATNVSIEMRTSERSQRSSATALARQVRMGAERPDLLRRSELASLKLSAGIY